MLRLLTYISGFFRKAQYVVSVSYQTDGNVPGWSGTVSLTSVENCLDGL